MSLPNFNEQLFQVFHQHVFDSPQACYLHTLDGRWSYTEANNVIYGVSERIKSACSAGTTTIILNFKDQKKLLFAFWACTALQVHVVLMPDHDHNELHYPAEIGGREAVLLLSDYLTSSATLDFDIDGVAESADWQFDGRLAVAVPNIYFFTSGTTGNAKLIKTTYFQLINAMASIAEHAMMPYTYRQQVLISVPLFHSYGISAVIEYTQGGSCLLLPKAKDNIAPLQALLDKKVSTTLTAIEGVPYFYKQLALLLTRVELPKIAHIGFGGDTVAPELLQDLYEALGNSSFSVRYGVTEIPSVIALNFFASTAVPSPLSLGRVVPLYNVLVNDEQAGMDAAHSFGELIIECEVAPKKTIRVATNDIVERIGDSFLFKGRTTYIKHRGYKINPVDIESFINKHDDVRESKVYPHNNTLLADIVTATGALDGIALKAFLGHHLPSYLIPEAFVAVAAIDRTRTGKIKRERIT
ncbi:class I adenylate-forming enzyme family protein [Sphingobacterium paludis]|uniref:Acyl-CoA synthetase (AMP-forming)/AMP-acid ligase II n=1 Tax=Sphingobacterium paludis TaxID=1476465 RepID=A0A4R7D2S2_9SPHI|nr:class I adenylate-forming enzyme family protein [Sphingobacterium paludis]TDS13884.1 acyl-CoA synthetase (AMP-forming)/AMP-acid ligase II [Sphingobacterium paludis]